LDIKELKKDIEIFGKGVERLEQLKAEFKQIDTSGNKEEADEVRSMLKNVSAIPQLEVKIAGLKNFTRDNLTRTRSNINKQVSKGTKYMLLERKYKLLLQQNNNKIYGKINNIRKSVSSLVSVLKIIKAQTQLQEKKLKTQQNIKESEKIALQNKDSKKAGKISSIIDVHEDQSLLTFIKNYYSKQGNPKSENKSQKFSVCQELLLKAKKSLQNKDKSKAKQFYFEIIDIYQKLEYLEKKEIYDELTMFYNELKNVL